MINGDIIQHGEDEFRIDKELWYKEEDSHGVATNAVRATKSGSEIITILWDEGKAIDTDSGEVVYNFDNKQRLASKIIRDGFSYAEKI